MERAKRVGWFRDYRIGNVVSYINPDFVVLNPTIIIGKIILKKSKTIINCYRKCFT